MRTKFNSHLAPVPKRAKVSRIDQLSSINPVHPVPGKSTNMVRYSTDTNFEDGTSAINVSQQNEQKVKSFSKFSLGVSAVLKEQTKFTGS